MGVRVRVSYPAPCTHLSFCPLSPWPLLPPCPRVRRLPQLSPMSTMLPVIAEPYVHEEIPAVEAAAEEEIAAEPYVHEEIAAEAYVHDATGDVAEEYVHVEPVVPAVAPVVAPAVTYAAYPYAGVYAGHAVAYPYAVYHTGCVNNVGSVVPCA